MKNITTLIAMAMLSTLGMGAFTSCDNDADFDVTYDGLKGVWMHEDRFDNDYDYIQFNADGTGTKWEVYKNAADGQRHDVENFTYTVKGNKITFTEADGDRDIETIKMKSANELVLDNDTYTKQK